MRNGPNRRPNRLREFDYRSSAAYFVTICSYRRECIFGDEERATLTQVWGHIGRYSPNARGDTFVAMPNHVHGIIWLARTTVGAQHTGNRNDTSFPPDTYMARMHPGSARAAPLHLGDAPRLFLPKDSLGAIVRAYKSAAAKRINVLRGTPGAPVWQRNYHDRIIRAGNALERIRAYIIDNPRKWADDPNNPDNISTFPPATTDRRAS